MAETDSELKLDMSVFQNEGEAYSSLTDINDIPIFTSSFREITEKVSKQEKQEEQHIAKQIFNDKMTDLQTNEELVQVLFQGETQRIIKKEAEIEESNSVLIYPMLGLFFAVFLVVMLGYCKKRSAKTEQAKAAIEDHFIV